MMLLRKKMALSLTTLSFLALALGIPANVFAQTASTSNGAITAQISSSPEEPLGTSSVGAPTSPANPTTKKLTLKEKLAARRKLMRERMKELLKNKYHSTSGTIPPSTVLASSAFDEYQIPELNHDNYETLSPPPAGSAPSATNIASNFFENIQLNENIPTTLYANEVLSLTGNASGATNNSTLFAFLNYTSADSQEHFVNFDAKTKGSSFSIPVYFHGAGNYYLGMVLGSDGKSKVKVIQVKAVPSAAETTSLSPDNAGLSLTYDATTDKTSIHWERNTNAFYRITFAQNAESVTYITRQNISQLPLRYTDFRNFKPGSVTISLATQNTALTSGWQTIGSFTTPITYHGLRSIETDGVTLQNEVPSILNTPSSIAIKGTALQNLENEASITNASGLVEKVTLKSSSALVNTGSHTVITKGSNFEFNYTPQVAGRYIIEINNDEGSAVINTPLYVQTGTPLIPDYMDMESLLSAKKHTADIATDRDQMLKMINIIRQGFGKSAITLDTQLNSLAQAHANDMVARDYFSHVNPDGLSPDDRRKNAQIPTEVGENLAYSQTLISSMQGLLRSPVHRANILIDDWTTVGIGVAADTNGYLKVVQEFSPDVLTNTRIAQIKTSTFAALNNAREKLGAVALTSDATLQDIADTWSSKLAATNEFGLTTKNGDSLSSMVEDAGIQSSVQLFVFSSNTAKDIFSRILEPSSAAEVKWQHIGLGMSATSLGDIKITVLLTK